MHYELADWIEDRLDAIEAAAYAIKSPWLRRPAMAGLSVAVFLYLSFASIFVGVVFGALEAYAVFKGERDD